MQEQIACCQHIHRIVSLTDPCSSLCWCYAVAVHNLTANFDWDFSLTNSRSALALQPDQQRYVYLFAYLSVCCMQVFICIFSFCFCIAANVFTSFLFTFFANNNNVFTQPPLCARSVHVHVVVCVCSANRLVANCFRSFLLFCFWIKFFLFTVLYFFFSSKISSKFINCIYFLLFIIFDLCTFRITATGDKVITASLYA